MFGRGRPKKTVTYAQGKEVKNAEREEEPRVPLPPAEEKAAEFEEADYFESAREYGFVEGISYAIGVLRQAQNEIIRRQKGE